MSTTVSGTIHAIFETKSVGAKGFMKREFIVETDEKYPQLLSIEATGDRTQLLDAVRAGEKVSVSINLKGRKWDGPNGTKFFNTLEAWKIERIGAPKSEPAAGGSVAQDDIPFASCDIASEPSPIAKVLR
jgi:hypothetical protein